MTSAGAYTAPPPKVAKKNCTLKGPDVKTIVSYARHLGSIRPRYLTWGSQWPCSGSAVAAALSSGAAAALTAFASDSYPLLLSLLPSFLSLLPSFLSLLPSFLALRLLSLLTTSYPLLLSLLPSFLALWLLRLLTSGLLMRKPESPASKMPQGSCIPTNSRCACQRHSAIAVTGHYCCHPALAGEILHTPSNM